MKNTYILISGLLISFACFSQPYFDVANFKYANSPDADLWRRQKQKNSFSCYSAGTNFPLIFKKDSTTIVFSPFFEDWGIKISSTNDLPNAILSFGLPVTLIKPVSKKWSALLSAIPRWNGYNGHFFSSTFQMGFAGIMSYKQRPGLIYKFGVYYNAEFSGTFIMPLLGIDWKIDNRNNLFGVLPGSLTYEHNVSGHLYLGGSFRAVTNSYQAGYMNYGQSPKFIRIDDNQLTAFADYYVSKNIVLNMELGHSVLRQLRLGEKNADQKYYYEQKMNDDVLIRIGIVYRVRLR